MFQQDNICAGVNFFLSVSCISRVSVVNRTLLSDRELFLNVRPKHLCVGMSNNMKVSSLARFFDFKNRNSLSQSFRSYLQIYV